MPNKSFRVKTFLVTVILLLIQATLVEAKESASSSQRGTSPGNRTLLSASSPFEDMVEYAISGNRKGIQQALREYDRQKADVSKILKPQSRLRMDELVTSIRKAEEHADYAMVAFESVDAYRLLMDSLDPYDLVVPVQVSLLDYEGFRLQTLLRFRPDDWPAIQKSAGEAWKYWVAIKPRVRDKGLVDAVDTAIAGMSDAAAKKDKEMAVFAAEMDLALVDLLESYFSSGRP